MCFEFSWVFCLCVIEMLKEDSTFLLNTFSLVQEEIGITIDLELWKRFCLRQMNYILTSQENVGTCSGKCVIFILADKCINYYH